MSVELQALRYLVPDEQSFWMWSDEGDVVCFRGSGTLAFREQLLAVLKPFANRSLPPLELVLLVLAACRESWPEERRAMQSDDSPLARSARPVLKQWWNIVFEALQKVQDLPSQIRSNPAAVATIVEIVFERYRMPSAPATEVLHILSSPRWMRQWDLLEPQIIPFGERTRGYSTLSRELLRVTVDEIQTRQATGLNELPVMDRLMGQLQELILIKEAPEVRTVRQLLDELREEDEFRGLVRAVRQLSAVLTLPCDLSIPEELPQGGVSDITNRGPLDRLLLSELANDDDTLMTRVALNEALYIRREKPPAHPVRERVLLIDAGIRMWGLPRFCAAVVGLCLASQELSGGVVRVFRSSVDGVKTVDFTTRNGLTEHLAALDCLAHPGDMLDEWIDEAVSSASEQGRSFAERKATLPTTTDRILITCEDVLTDSEFYRQLRTCEPIPSFVVTVNRQGRIRLIRLTSIGEKLLKEMWLDLDDLSGAKEQPQNTLVDPTAKNRLPAIFQLNRLPLRMPYPLHGPEALASYPQRNGHEAGLLQITKDRRLLLWDQAKRGGRQITEKLPIGQLRWSGELLNENTFTMVLTRQGGYAALAHLTHVSLGELDCNCIPVNVLNDRQHVYAVVADNAVLMFILKGAVIVVWPPTGDRIATSQFQASMRWIRGRFFVQSGTFYQVGYSGGEIHFDKVFDPVSHGLRYESVLGIVGPPDDLVAVLSTGELLNITTKVRSRLAGPSAWRLGSVSPDGMRFVISSDRGSPGIPQHVQVALGHPGQVIPTDYPAPYWLFGLQWWPSDEAIFRQPHCLAYGQHLMIVTKKSRRLLLDIRKEKNGVMHLRDYTTSDDPHYRNASPFVDIPSPPDVGYTLKQVTWSDGSRAVLDSRGMLHLQSSDRTIPELTLVLCEKHVSGWCSTGEVWGRDYFIDETVPGIRKTSPGQIMPILRQFLERLP